MKPSDFYFQLKNDKFIITSKQYYDTEGILNGLYRTADLILPKQFEELSPNYFKYDGNPEIGKTILLNIGFIEIDFGIDENNETKEANEVKETEDSGLSVEQALEGLDELNEKLEGERLPGFDVDDIELSAWFPSSTSDMSMRELNKELNFSIQRENYERAAELQKEIDKRIRNTSNPLNI